MEYSTIIKTNLNHLVNETAKFIKKKKFNSRRTFDLMYYNLVASNQHKKKKQIMCVITGLKTMEVFEKSEIPWLITGVHHRRQ